MGLDWSSSVVTRRNIVGKAVMNTSFGGSFSATMSHATENRDESQGSPASPNGVCTVTASSLADAPASFSSYSFIVDYYVPGVDITTRLTVMDL
ncbi:hypothetical protein H112_02795 [Trichophyton rubrum D6]|nr:uncharacterized protein TERG_12284 [Trichophyton rubrum CBS 118892]EZF24689.1 hypothetical protein H100_02801 [Trichophyton rubrum MR850]EZF43756.1 hypothetical protein H102_02794 [Trichophyton rubrum CBS 100081]EZF54349.1 hypothetical protein H103_02806 [Trichophyton rubrum CBS 288.86]EZF65040.1 hypothetical protein H104_02785 [Trichophyton rubrum CBS 289.86]EZF75617.1 hypothetical protein H105_02811 [Trichophyton soudanense CBS 452.61]EZF86247.1 hypothetical protein H110_02804 [Trichophy